MCFCLNGCYMRHVKHNNHSKLLIYISYIRWFKNEWYVIMRNVGLILFYFWSTFREVLGRKLSCMRYNNDQQEIREKNAVFKIKNHIRKKHILKKVSRYWKRVLVKTHRIAGKSWISSRIHLELSWKNLLSKKVKLKEE